jgi:hypothetical protein
MAVATQEDVLSHAKTHFLSLKLDNDIVRIRFEILKHGINSNLLFESRKGNQSADLCSLD